LKVDPFFPMFLDALKKPFRFDFKDIRHTWLTISRSRKFSFYCFDKVFTPFKRNLS
jgi:hypothetical protein